MAATRPPEELYDVSKDPNELQNLADRPEQRATLVEMRRILDRWITETGDRGEVAEDPAIAASWAASEEELRRAPAQAVQRRRDGNTGLDEVKRLSKVLYRMKSRACNKVPEARKAGT